MSGILLTPYSGMILGPIAKVLGYLMNGIFILLDKIGVPNTGLAIIIFTIVIYLLLMPLTIKQQKFSKLSAKMNPEIQAIQAKYKGKKDNDSHSVNKKLISLIFSIFHSEISGRDFNDLHPAKTALIDFTLDVFHFEISGKDIKEKQFSNKPYKSETLMVNLTYLINILMIYNKKT